MEEEAVAVVLQTPVQVRLSLPVTEQVLVLALALALARARARVQAQERVPVSRRLVPVLRKSRPPEPSAGPVPAPRLPEQKAVMPIRWLAAPAWRARRPPHCLSQPWA